jgi:hypothetical protein
MYNIHALREQWDYYTIATKLARIIDLYKRDIGAEPNEVELSELTGLTRGAIRRCRLIVDLPARFQELLLQELGKPKSQQRLSEDFFIEMEKSLKTVTRRLPVYQERIDNIRDVLVAKFKSKLITAVTDFRQLSKIATASDTLGIAKGRVTSALNQVFDENAHISIKQAYTNTVAFQYEERKAGQQATALAEFLEGVIEREDEAALDEDLHDALNRLADLIENVLRGRK